MAGTEEAIPPFGRENLSGKRTEAQECFLGLFLFFVKGHGVWGKAKFLLGFPPYIPQGDVQKTKFGPQVNHGRGKKEPGSHGRFATCQKQREEIRMNVKTELMYTKNHEWVEKTGEGTAKIGITDYAQSELGDLVFVNLPEEGDALTAGEGFADVESVKAVSDIHAPVSGQVKAINEAVLDEPELINKDAYAAWLVEVENAEYPSDLLSAWEYEAFLKEVG